MSDIITIGVIGLGNVGTPILYNLYKSKKYKLVAFDIDKNKLNDVPKDISKANSIKDLAQKCKVVLTCLPKPEHVLQAVDGEDGLLQNATSGMIWVDTSTTDFKQTQKLSEKAKTYGVSMLEATLTGGVHALQNNNMVCLAGGDKEIFNNWKEVLQDAIGEVVVLCGNIGAGANLIILSRTEKDLKQVSQITKRFKVQCKYYVCDVTKYSEIKSVINAQKRIDIVVNNAGTNIPEHFTKVKRKDMEYLVKVNTEATFNIAQMGALKMIKQNNRKKIGGAIINMSSQMGHVGGPIRSVYNMTKFGLEGLTKGMSIDLAKYNIRVNTVCPTFVVTPMTKKFLKSKKFKREVLGNIPLGRFAELSDIASAVVFLASDQASMITGTSLLVDGGWTAR